MTDRAALLEKVTELIANGCNCDRACGGNILDCGCKCDATAAIDLIRAETLEEAEAICRDKQRAGKDAQSCAAAIRALKEKP
jgi:hypothetical protein